jgi:hypothetical protein
LEDCQVLQELDLKDGNKFIVIKLTKAKADQPGASAAPTAPAPAAAKAKKEQMINRHAAPVAQAADDESADESANDESTDDEVADDKAADDEPADDEPADDEPADDEPTDDEAADDEAADDETADDEPADDEAADHEPADHEPADHESANDESTDVESLATDSEAGPRTRSELKAWEVVLSLVLVLGYAVKDGYCMKVTAEFFRGVCNEPPFVDTNLGALYQYVKRFKERKNMRKLFDEMIPRMHMGGEVVSFLEGNPVTDVQRFAEERKAFLVKNITYIRSTNLRNDYFHQELKVVLPYMSDFKL